MLLRELAHGKHTKRLLGGLLILNLLLLLFFICFDYQLIFHSDAAVKNLLAQEIYETGQYFPRQWNYINNDLWVLYVHTWIVPLLAIMPNGYATHAISDIVSAALILGSTWLVTGVLGQSRPARMLSMLIISSGMSLFMAEHVFGQAAYGSMYYMGCLLLYSYWALSHAAGAARWRWSAATLGLTVLIFCANPQRALIYYGLPLAAAAAALQMIDWQDARGHGRRPSWRQAGQLALVALAIAGGTALNHHILKLVHNTAGLTQLNWVNFDGMVRNVMGTVHGLISMFDGMPRLDTPVVSAMGAYMLLRTLTALVVLALLPWALLKTLQPQRRGACYIAVFTLTSMLLNLLITLSTGLADMNAPESAIRYLVPPLLLMVLLLVSVIVDRRTLRPAMRVVGLTALAVLATSAPATYLYPYVDWARGGMHHGLVVTQDTQLIDYLEQQGLHYGYATYWNAGKLTVLSAQQLRIRAVDIADGLPLPSRNLGSDRWYQPQAWQGPTFLLLTTAEAATLKRDALAALTGAPRVLDYQGWHILVFNDNLARTLPLWRR
ncbi:hypothetical protein [Rugamonas sp.]|uniref:hypothetical protein n=1 Tax=Rugamonas sp. TaxID=1926287 RepID=UPI0025D12223|nr:hypothetical protein [Rugamonas sp.]